MKSSRLQPPRPPTDLLPLRQALSTPENKSRYVRRLFATIADKYDFVTVALSYGQDRRWKRQLISLATSLAGAPVAPGAPLSGRRALDLATGTGDLAFALASAGACVVGLDITPRMIELARTKADRRTCSCTFVVGDMLTLPFPDRSFDVVTTGYGLRNVPNLSAAVDEMARVLTAGGVALSLDFNRPPNRLVCNAYLLYLTVVGSILGWLLHKDADTYRYIPASIRRYPGAEAVARLMEARGFTEVRYVPVLGGLMAIHRGRRSG